MCSLAVASTSPVGLNHLSRRFTRVLGFGEGQMEDGESTNAAEVSDEASFKRVSGSGPTDGAGLIMRTGLEIGRSEF